MRYSLSLPLLKFGTRQSINDSRRLMYVPTSNYRQMRAQSVGRSVGHHRRAREGGRVISSLPCSAKGTQPVVSSSASVVVSVSRLALHRSSLAPSVTRTWRIVRFFFLLVFFPCGTLQLSQFTAAALQIIHAFGADHSRTARFLLPSFVPSFFPCFSLFNPPLATKIITKND